MDNRQDDIPHYDWEPYPKGGGWRRGIEGDDSGRGTSKATASVSGEIGNSVRGRVMSNETLSPPSPEEGWRQQIKTDRKEVRLWHIPRASVRKLGFEDGARWKLQVTFPDGTRLLQTEFLITSGLEVAFNAVSQRAVRERIATGLSYFDFRVIERLGRADSSHRPEIEVFRTERGWLLDADAFVVPLGMNGALAGATYRSLIADQGQSGTLEQDIRRALPPNFGPTKPVILTRKTGKVDHLILATAYDRVSTRPDTAFASILSLDSGFGRIVVPLLGGAEIPSKDVLNAFYKVISDIRLPRKLTVTLVVIDQEVEQNANLLFLAFRKAPNINDFTLPSQHHYSNDAVDGHPVTDCMGVEDRADDFSRLLTSKNVNLPLAIGLFGDWGSGKSFFMKLIRQRMEELSFREAYVPTGGYCTNIAHITFNAWHYLDSNLWPSLALRIFEGVAACLGGGKPEDPLTNETAQKKRELAAVIESSQRTKIEAGEAIKAAAADRRACEERLAKLRTDRSAKLHSLACEGFSTVAENAKEAAALFGVKVEGFDALEKAIQEGRTTIGRLTPVIRGFLPGFPYGRPWAAMCGVGGLGLVGFAFSSIVTDFLPGIAPVSPIAGWVGTAAAVSGWAVHRLTKGRKALDSLVAISRSLRAAAEAPAAAQAEELRRLDAEIEGQKLLIALADKEIEAAETRLQQIKAGALVYEFLKERSGDSRYVDGMGIISVLRQDLERLRDRLKELNQNADGIKIERIVLYIDDLDRCDPERVVEVLQAVHLLLAFDLFAVVVAVDPRWLERSLYKRYLPGFESMSEDQLIASEFSPQNYLEKIFQIPYRIPTMEAGAFGRLIDHLRPVPAPIVQTLTEPVVIEAENEGNAIPAIEEAAIPGPNFVSPGNAPKPIPMEISDHEIEVLKTIAPLIGTPRTAKRLMNVYALIRMRARGAYDLYNPHTDDCRSLAILLALDIGFPRVSRLVRHELREKTGPFLLMIDDLKTRCGTSHQGLQRQFQRIATEQERFGVVRCESMARWLPYVEDYSFHDTMSLDFIAAPRVEGGEKRSRS